MNRDTTAQGTSYHRPLTAPTIHRVRDTGAKLEKMRPAGEPPLWLGAALIAVGAVVGVFVAVVL